MKKVKFSALAFVVFSMSLVFYSCGDNSSTNLTEADILGFWRNHSFSLLANDEVVYFNDEFDQESCVLLNFNIKKDNVLEQIVAVDGVDGNCDSITHSYYWELKDQMLRFNKEQASSEFQIRKEGSHLILSQYITVDEGFMVFLSHKYSKITHDFVLGEEVVLENSFRKE